MKIVLVSRDASLTGHGVGHRCDARLYIISTAKLFAAGTWGVEERWG